MEEYVINWVALPGQMSELGDEHLVEESLEEQGSDESRQATPSGRNTPPPTYEQCMKTAVPLSFMDFWPLCIDVDRVNFLNARFESFDRLMEEANKWLNEQSDIIVRNCETVEIKVSSLDEYILYSTTKTSTYKNPFRPALYVKGLRIWYTSKILNKLSCSFASTPCRIAHMNIRPAAMAQTNRGVYEMFPALIEKCNNYTGCGLINGRILNVETVTIKEPEYDDSAILNMAVDPDQSAWRDSCQKVALQFLRVYFLPEQAVKDELHFVDFLPECVRKSKHNPKYKDFGSVMDDCRLWLLQLGHDSRILNAQTIDAKYPHRSVPTPDSKQTFHQDYEALPRIRTLRVYFVKPEGAPNQNYLAPLLSHKTFVPASYRRRKHESLATLMRRVESWLRATGANVVSAETLTIEEPVYHGKGDPDLSIFHSEYADSGTEFDQVPLLYVIRVYLDTVYPEPPLSLLSGEPDPEEEDCCIL